jgi:hypothetical protein
MEIDTSEVSKSAQSDIDNTTHKRSTEIAPHKLEET